MEDRIDPSWRIIIRHESRSLRRVDDQEQLVFGARGAVEEMDLVEPQPREQVNACLGEGDEIQGKIVRASECTGVEEKDEAHVGDMQYSEDKEED